MTKESEECCVCMENIADQVKFKCKHKFCKGCVGRLNICAICRENPINAPKWLVWNDYYLLINTVTGERTLHPYPTTE